LGGGYEIRGSGECGKLTSTVKVLTWARESGGKGAGERGEGGISKKKNKGEKLFLNKESLSNSRFKSTSYLREKVGHPPKPPKRKRCKEKVGEKRVGAKECKNVIEKKSRVDVARNEED